MSSRQTGWFNLRQREVSPCASARALVRIPVINKEVSLHFLAGLLCIGTLQAEVRLPDDGRLLALAAEKMVKDAHRASALPPDAEKSSRVLFFERALVNGSEMVLFGYEVAQSRDRRWCRTILLNSEGHEVIGFPEAERLFDENTPLAFPGADCVRLGTIISLAADEQAIALVVGGFPLSPQNVVVITPEADPRVLLSYQKPADVADMAGELFICDVDGDGRTEIVAFLNVAVFEGAEVVVKSRLLSFRQDEKTREFREAKDVDPGELRNQLERARRDPTVKRIKHTGGVIISNQLGL